MRIPTSSAGVLKALVADKSHGTFRSGLLRLQKLPVVITIETLSRAGTGYGEQSVEADSLCVLGLFWAEKEYQYTRFMCK